MIGQFGHGNFQTLDRWGMSAWWQDHQALIGWITAGSLVLFFATLLAIPPLVARIPPDYFVRHRRVRLVKAGPHVLLGYVMLVGKNLLGLLLLVAGIALLVLPGQGLITMLIGLLFLDFPGKFRLERRVVALPSVLKTLNWLRHKSGRPPLIPPVRDQAKSA
jgi:hypothetical protein